MSRRVGVARFVLVPVAAIAASFTTALPATAGAVVFPSIDAEFPVTAPGETSTLLVPVRNTGSEPARIDEITIDFGGSYFTVAGGSCAPDGEFVMIAPGSACSLEVSFTPIAAGVSKATVSLSSSSDGYTRSTWTGRSATTFSGYWMIDQAGKVYPFGDATAMGNGPPTTIVDIESTPSGLGYWTIDQLGRVSAFGSAKSLGDFAFGLQPGETVTAISSTPTANGYWIFTSKGRVQRVGDAVHHGDMSATTLNGPVLDSIVTTSGNGYYMVASDGGIFSFGDAPFWGSMGAAKLNAPVQSLVPDGDGRGYWLVANDGGIFSFEAPFHGSMGHVRLNRPVTGMVRSNDGYLMVGEDGGIFTFGNAVFRGSLGANPPAQPIVAVTPFGR